MKKKLLAVVAAIAILFTLASCESSEGLMGISGIGDIINVLKGGLIGNDYNIQEFDNFGNLVFTAHGDKISMAAETDDEGEPTSYIDITIDGFDWKHVGSTLVFAQNGVDIITDFQVPEDMSVDHSSSTGLMPVDRYINGYRNFFGKKLVILVSSQMGTPICLMQGDDCTVTIPSDLPKMTRVYIDGKSVYVHRANVDVFPTQMFK